MRRTVVILAWSLVLASVVGVATAATASRSAVSVYPRAVKARAGALAACPNPAGLEPFNSTTTTLAVHTARAYGHISLSHDLRASDRAWWPQARRKWSAGRPALGRSNVTGTSPLETHGDLSSIIRRACGDALIPLTQLVGIIPIGQERTGCNACRSDMFFVDRRGRALIYYLY
jgi:hypothetical protein